MKRLIPTGIVILIIIAVTLFSIQISQAAMNPAPPFCEHQGYRVTEIINGTEYCDFGDGNKCEIWQFLRGECGNDYRKDFPCVKEDQFVFSFENCCDGLEPYLKCRMIGQPKCRPIPNIFQKFWEGLLCFFGL